MLYKSSPISSRTTLQLGWPSVIPAEILVQQVLLFSNSRPSSRLQRTTYLARSLLVELLLQGEP